MPKKKSTFNRLTWVLTELVFGLAGLIYGLLGTISSEVRVTYIILLSLGGVLLIVATVQLIIYFKKKEKIYCAKCGERIKKNDEFCSKCGEKIEEK
ncbi:MAG: zinc ribbon domain-containing protein [Candidatus Heimdallarchaeota archaeon]|nr:zinc ribbon domain-containing protein [Candidatus Heimdallarchaeota archaeon]